MSMFYTKNVPMFERIARVVGGVAVAATGLMGPAGTTVGIVLALTGVFVGLTGFVGFCPMCAMVGRRLPKS